MAAFAPAAHRQYAAAHPHKSHRFLRWLGGLVVVLIGIGIQSLAAGLLSPSPVSCSPPACSVPPPRAAVSPAIHHYTSSTYGYSLDYSTANITPSQKTGSAISWDAQLGDGSEVAWSFHGLRPGGRDAQQLVQDIQGSNYPDASFAYTIPQADLGYTPGYGNVYDLTESPGNGQVLHERLLVIAAVKHNVAVVFLGIGPYRQTSPNSDGHPNPASTPLVNLGDVDTSLKSVVWKDDPAL